MRYSFNLTLSLVLIAFTADVFAATTQVTTRIAGDLLFYPQKNAAAEVISLNNSEIASLIPAKLSSFLVKVGDWVTHNQVLARLECLEFDLLVQLNSSQYDQLVIQLEFSKRQLQRTERLAKNNNAGEAELDQKRTNIQATEAQIQGKSAMLTMAKMEQARCEIRAPFDGVVIERMTDEGEWMNKGQALLQLQAINAVELSVQIALSDIVDFSKAISYEFIADSQSFPIALRTLLPTVDAGSRARMARFEFTEGKALPGLKGRINWLSGQQFLPANLLVKRGNAYGIFVMDSDRANFIEVANAEEGRPIPIELEVDREVIVDGRHGLVNDQQVVIIKTYE